MRKDIQPLTEAYVRIYEQNETPVPYSGNPEDVFWVEDLGESVDRFIQSIRNGAVYEQANLAHREDLQEMNMPVSEAEYYVVSSPTDYTQIAFISR